MLDVQCGRGYSVAMVSQGKLVTWGGNNNGQLGRGEEVEDCMIPRCVCLSVLCLSMALTLCIDLLI